MPSCTLTQGFLTDCLDGIAGARGIFFANYSDLESQLTIDNDGIVTDIPVVTLYRYTGTKNSISAGNAPVPSRENGTMYYNHTATIKVPKQNATKHKEILGILARARVVAFVWLASNEIIMLGYEDGLFLDPASNAGSGLAKGDFEGYDLTFIGEEPNQGRFLQAYTQFPFDNYVDVTLDPPFEVIS